MADALTIRPAAEEDYSAACALLDELDALHREELPRVFRDPETVARSRDYVGSILADDDQALLLAEGDGEAVGLAHAAMRESRDFPILVARRSAVVENLVVAPAWRRRGVGRRLMDAVEAWAQERGASEIELNVWEFNRQAVGFYQVLGYQTVSRRMWKRLADE
ncbi:MAG: N-acetyltransferase family protein [Planctomycetota bacterium]